MKYNNNWLQSISSNQMQLEFLLFWGHQPNEDGSLSKSCFSQWWIAPFEVDGIACKTAEHWMMAEKARLFNDEDSRQQIITSDTPAEAKKKGRLIRDFDPTTWDKEKFDIVVLGNFHKFSKNTQLASFLLDTGNKVIVEASPLDNIWGIGMAANDPSVLDPKRWKGENLLGYALMEVRDKLKRLLQ